MRKRLLVLIAPAFVAGCASVARIEVADKPNYKQELFRYVLWNDKTYSPAAFEYAARHKVCSLVLLKGNADSIRCTAALSGALSIPAA